MAAALWNRRYLHRDGLSVSRRLLQREDELAKILDRVDVVMGRGRDGVGALGDHARARHLGGDLLTGKMPADAGLGPLADLLSPPWRRAFR